MMTENIAQTFDELNLTPGTLEILASRGFATPTPIQALVIPKLLENTRDLIAQARTGTGKTAAYALPVIEQLLVAGKQKLPRALVLAPTRELAMQIAGEVEQFIGERDLKTVTVYGGQPIEIQLKSLKGGADIIVGTPGRVIDLMERSALKLQQIEFAILDEADEMLDMGFVEDIESILSATPEEKRMLMFSATVPPEARKIAETFMHEAEYIKAPVSAAETEQPLTEQWACEVRREDKFHALKRILNAEGRIYAMIFCRTRSDVDELTMNLQKNKFSAEALHGELTQNQRTRVIEQFKSRRFDMLVATDVAARGIDVNDLTHVINYALPMNSDIYIHRIGRTGRAGKKGVAISIFSPSEGSKFAMIKKATKGALTLRPLPDAKAIIAAKKSRFKDKLQDFLSTVHPVYQQLAYDLSSEFDPESVLAALLEMHFHKELLPENYPSLGKASRDRNPHSRNRRHDNNSHDRESGRRRRHDPPRNEKAAGEKNSKPTHKPAPATSVAEKPSRGRARQERNQEPPRKKLRDWAINLTGEMPDLPRYKVKKRK